MQEHKRCIDEREIKYGTNTQRSDIDDADKVLAEYEPEKQQNCEVVTGMKR